MRTVGGLALLLGVASASTRAEAVVIWNGTNGNDTAYAGCANFGGSDDEFVGVQFPKCMLIT